MKLNGVIFEADILISHYLWLKGSWERTVQST